MIALNFMIRRQQRYWCDECIYSEEAIGEDVVEADHPGIWHKWQEKILSKWNKVKLIYNLLEQPPG